MVANPGIQTNALYNLLCVQSFYFCVRVQFIEKATLSARLCFVSYHNYFAALMLSYKSRCYFKLFCSQNSLSTHFFKISEHR